MKSSGKFVLRIEPEFHALLRDAASRNRISLNQVCLQRLIGLSGSEPEAIDLIHALLEGQKIHGDDLLGLVVFGSWARDEERRGSDVDLLIVLKTDTPIQRALYSRWEELDLKVGRHSIEPAIVSLPPPHSSPSGLWAEVALDGIILWDLSGDIQRHLVRVRRAIAGGELRREKSHGQNYWIHRSEAG